MSDLKQALLHGVDHRESVRLKQLDGTEIEATVRPLNSKEAAEANAITMRNCKGPMDQNGNVEITVDVSTFQRQQWEADVRVVACGLSHDGEEWTDDEVSQMLPEHVRQLAEAIRGISGMGSVGPAESFRDGEAGE